MERTQPAVRVAPARHLPLSARLVVTFARLTGATRASGVFATVARHRRLSRWWLPFAGTLLLRGTLPRADAELVVLRTAWNCAGWYEWVQHVPLAKRAGLDEAEISRVPSGAEDPGWSRRQHLLLEATDELHGRHLIGERVWAELAELLTPEECIELCFLVGHYEMVAMTLNALGVWPEPEALAELDEASAKLGACLRRRLAEALALQP